MIVAAISVPRSVQRIGGAAIERQAPTFNASAVRFLPRTARLAGTGRSFADVLQDFLHLRCREPTQCLSANVAQL